MDIMKAGAGRGFLAFGGDAECAVVQYPKLAPVGFDDAVTGRPGCCRVDAQDAAKAWGFGIASVSGHPT